MAGLHPRPVVVSTVTCLLHYPHKTTPPLKMSNPISKAFSDPLPKAKEVIGFGTVFSSSKIAPRSFFVRGSKALFREHYYRSDDYPVHWLRLIQTCRRLELPSTEEESGSAVNATAIYRTFPFLDGGLISREGNYFSGLKGTWIIGIRAVRFACYEIGVQQPRRFRGEKEVPSHQALLAHITWQMDETPDQIAALHKELDSFR